MNENFPPEEQKDRVQSAEDIKKKRSLIEAALYVAGYPLELKTLCSIAHLYSKKKIYEIAKSLAEEYKNRDGCLEILELEGQKFVMQLKPEYVSRVRRLSIKPLLTEGPLRTLSYIAYRQPVAQAKVIGVRGAQAYDHISKLMEMGLISREKFGKSHMLKTTELFASYFGLSKELHLMKKQLEALFSNRNIQNEKAPLKEESAS